MKSYGQYCSIAKSVEVLGERWSILVLRELLIGSTRFNDIACGLPGMSRTMLSKRLREFEAAGLIERLDGEYLLTPGAQELRPIVFGLGRWGRSGCSVSPIRLTSTRSRCSGTHARFDTSQLPDRRVVIAFVLHDRSERFWVVVEPVGCSVCEADPGFDVDVTVRGVLTDFYRVFNHQLDIGSALRSAALRFEGEPAIVRRMPKVLDLIDPARFGVDASSPRPVWRS